MAIQVDESPLLTIRNEFPGIARFVESVPPPDRVGPEGVWAEWDLGSLDMGQMGSIQVTVRIAPDLPPSTTITIWDGIFNHAGMMVDEVFTRYHIPRPPVTFPDGDWPWYAQEEITVLPEPPIAGQPTELCAEVVNHDVLNPSSGCAGIQCLALRNWHAVPSCGCCGNYRPCRWISTRAASSGSPPHPRNGAFKCVSWLNATPSRLAGAMLMLMSH